MKQILFRPKQKANSHSNLCFKTFVLHTTAQQSWPKLEDKAFPALCLHKLFSLFLAKEHIQELFRFFVVTLVLLDLQFFLQEKHF